MIQQLFLKYFGNRLLNTSGKSVHLCESYGRIIDNASNHVLLIKVWMLSQPIMVERKREYYLHVNLGYSRPLRANTIKELELSHLKIQTVEP